MKSLFLDYIVDFAQMELLLDAVFHVDVDVLLQETSWVFLEGASDVTD